MDQEHAAEMRTAFNNLNADLVGTAALRPALESPAPRATHRALPPLRPEARRGGGQFPQSQERRRPAGLRTLSEKFQLFEGVFGASDEVLGAIESGVDFEKRINDIYQRCRKHEDIRVAFDQLQRELSLEINESMTQTRRKLLETFDDEVREKLKVRAEAPDHQAALARMQKGLRLGGMPLTRDQAHERH